MTMSFYSTVKTGQLCATDTETTGIRSFKGDMPFMVSFCNEDDRQHVVTFDVDPMTRQPVINKHSKKYRDLKRFLERDDITWVLFNAKFDVHMLNNIDIWPNVEHIEEVSFAVRMYMDEWAYKLKPLAAKYVDIAADDEAHLHHLVISCRKQARKLGWKLAVKKTHGDKPAYADYWVPRQLATIHPDLPFFTESDDPDLLNDCLSVCSQYAGIDAYRTLALWWYSEAAFEDEPSLAAAYAQERVLMPYIYQMERRGVRVDLSVSRQEVKRAQRVRAENWKKVVEVAGGGFNPNSSPQKQRLLFNELGLEPIHFTKSGAPSTDKDTLEFYAEQGVDFCRHLREWDKANRAINNYHRKYVVESRSEPDGRIIHTTFHQNGAHTGRLSASNPPLQQIPKRAKDGPMASCRRPFIPRAGYRWLCPDYSQIEARIFASESRDELMCNAFRDGRDVYVELLTRTEQLCAIDLSKKYGSFDLARGICKNNFLGKLYGEGADKLARAMRLPKHESQLVVEALESAFPRVLPYMAEMQDLANETGYIVTAYGRRVFVPWDEIYKAVNYNIQGSAAGLIKRAMVNAGQFLKGCETQMLMQIHDELIFEIPDAEWCDDLVQGLAACMVDAAEDRFSVPITVDVEVVTEHWNKKEAYNG